MKNFNLFVIPSVVVGFALLPVACGSDDSSGAQPAGGSAGAAADGGAGKAGSSGTAGQGGSSAGAGQGGSSAGAGPGDGAAGEGGPTSCSSNTTKSCTCASGIGAQRSPDGSGWSACECAAYGLQLAVSPQGDDQATGDLQHPFATPGRAQQAVRDAIGKGIPAGGIVVWLRAGTWEIAASLQFGAQDSGQSATPVVWRGYPGETARLSGARKLDPNGFKAVASTDAIYQRLDPSARDHVLQLDLKALGITDFGTLDKRGFCGAANRSAMELFVDGAAMQLARWPDAAENTVKTGLETAAELDLFGTASPDVTGHYVKDGTQDQMSAFSRDALVGGLQYHLYRSTWDYQGSTYTAWFLSTQANGYPSDTNPWWYRYDPLLGSMDPSAGGTGKVTTSDPQAVNHGFSAIAEGVSNTQWRYHGDRPTRWTDVADLRFHGFWKYAWADCHLGASAIDTATRTVTLSEASDYGIEQGQPWYAYNMPEEITVPGEWWVDRASGLLVVWPPAGFAQSELGVSLLKDPVLQTSDAHDLEFRDLTIEASRSTLVSVNGGDHVRLIGLTLRNAGTDAASVSGTGHEVGHCEVYGTGNGGVRLSGGDRPGLTAGGNVVEHSHFHDLSRMEWTYRPAVSLSGVGNIVRHNLMHAVPHSAILYGGNEHVIEFNDIHHVCQFSSDAGAIYAGRDWGARGNVIRANFIHEVSTFFEGYGVHGIYLDDCLSGIQVEGNVLYKISGYGIEHGGGRDNTMVNNVIARCGAGLSADSRGFEWQPSGGPNNTPGDSWNLLEKLENVGYQKDPWATKYPSCAAIPDDFNAIMATGALWLWPQGCSFSRNIGFANGSWINATQGTLDVYAAVQDNLENTDPKFVDEASLNLALQPDSPAYGIPGFQAIAFDQIGIKP